MQYQSQAVAEKRATARDDGCIIQDPDIVVEVKQITAPPGDMLIKAAEAVDGIVVSSSRLPGCYQVERISFDKVLSDLDILVKKE